MDVNKEEERGAYRWLFIVGTIAILFTIFLSRIDDGLTYSDSELRLRDTLKELRGAQAGLPAGPVDSRLVAVPLNAAPMNTSDH